MAWNPVRRSAVLALSRPRTQAEAVVAARLRDAEQQVVYRRLVEAAARPGRMVWMPSALVARLPPELLPALVLADRTTPLAILAPGDGDGAVDWEAAVVTVTRAPIVPLASASIVVARRPMEPEELAAVLGGARASGGCHVVLGCQMVRPGGLDTSVSFDGQEPQVLLEVRGPGVERRRTLSITGIEPGIVRALFAPSEPLPRPIDCWFVAESGCAVGLPRSVDVDVLGEWRLAG